jgi:hypothetical protein
MVTVRYIPKVLATGERVVYVMLYNNNKFVKSLGREDKLTVDRINFEKRKANKKC